MITSEPPFNRDSRLTTQALHCDRGRPARYEHRKVRGSRQALNFRCSVRAARSLRAGRPRSSEELEWSVSTDERGDYPLEYFGLEWRGNVFVAARGECPFTKLIRTVS